MSVTPSAFAFLVGFGLLVGILFGFFGAGGSVLVTPGIMLFDLGPVTATGTSLAVVFGSATSGTLKHRACGNLDVGLAVLMAGGTALGMELGKVVVAALASVGAAGEVLSMVYAMMLCIVGSHVLRDGRVDEGLSALALRLRDVEVPPTVDPLGQVELSVWVVLATAVGVGMVAGTLGVGGIFLLVPAMVYAFGLPTPSAMGTAMLQIALASAVGTFVYASTGAVDLWMAGMLLAGSGLGARIGAGATAYVDEAELERAFATTMFAGAGAVVLEVTAVQTGIEAATMAAAALLAGVTLFVDLTALRASWAAFKDRHEQLACRLRRDYS